jgi:hypothetical protein
VRLNASRRRVDQLAPSEVMTIIAFASATARLFPSAAVDQRSMLLGSGSVLVSRFGAAFILKQIALLRSWRDPFATLDNRTATSFHFPATRSNFDQFTRIWCFLAGFVCVHETSAE